MGWERRGGRLCYYHPRRVDGRVVKDYHGSGPVAQLAADLMDEGRDRRADRVRAREAERVRLAELDEATAELDLACTAACEAVRERGAAMTQGSESDDLQAVPSLDLDEIRELLRRAAAKEPGALPGLRAAFDRRPEIWHRLGDLAGHVEAAWIAALAGSDAGLAEVFTRKAADLRRELGGAAPSTLERLLVDRVVACWLQVHHADLAAARPRESTAEGRDRATRRQSAADRRYAGAIEALARLRRTPPAAATRIPTQGAPSCGPVASDHEPDDVVPFAPLSEGRGSSGTAGSTEERRGRRRVRRS